MTVGHLDASGCRIRYSVEGDGPVTLVLVHGAGAHRLWWHRMVPSLAEDHRVVTFDLSGHGDSERRTAYGPTVYGRETHAVATALGRGDVVVVGHSMGGRAAVMAAGTRPRDFAGVVLLDTVFPESGPRREPEGAERTLGIYPDEQCARARFRLVPPQPHPGDAAVAPVVGYALARTSDGWTWKFDPQSLWRYEDEQVDAALRAIRAPMTYAYGTESALSTDRSAMRIQQVQPDVRVVPVEGGHHHLPLDSQKACVNLIRDMTDGLVGKRRRFTSARTEPGSTASGGTPRACSPFPRGTA